MTADIDSPTARVITLPVSPADLERPKAVGEVLAQVFPLAAFRRSPVSVAAQPEFARRCAALQATGAWRRAHPAATFDEDLAAAERISREFGL